MTASTGMNATGANGAKIVMRNVTMHAQPRSLLRHGATLAESASIVSIASAVQQKQDSFGAEQEAEAAARAAARARGHDEGHAAGFAEGMRDALTQVDHAIREAVAKVEADAARQQQDARCAAQEHAERLLQLSDHFGGAADARLASLQDDAIALAFEAVCQCVGTAVVSHDHVAAVIAHRIGLWRGGALLTVRINPDDLASLQRDDAGRKLMQRNAAVQWLADASIDAGGCVLEAERGTLDARMATQLDRLRSLWQRTASSADAHPEAEAVR